MEGPGLILPSGIAFDFIETFSHVLAEASGAPGANVCIYHRVRPRKSLHTSTVKWRVGTTDAAGHVDAGVSSLTTGGVATKLASTGSTAVGAVGVQAATLAFDWVAGQDYWVTFVTDSGTAAFGRHQFGSAAMGAEEQMDLFKASAFPIADQTGVTSGNNVPVWMRFV